jgi:predicted DNA-binding ribbon-helix-helix protein
MESPVATQNLTVSLDRETIRKAKVIAAQRGVSVSRLVTEIVVRLAGDDDAYQSAMRQAVETLEAGLDFGGAITATRDELHDRPALR